MNSNLSNSWKDRRDSTLKEREALSIEIAAWVRQIQVYGLRGW